MNNDDNQLIIKIIMIINLDKNNNKNNNCGEIITQRKPDLLIK